MQGKNEREGTIVYFPSVTKSNNEMLKKGKKKEDHLKENTEFTKQKIIKTKCNCL